jgi:hypothetical protein
MKGEPIMPLRDHFHPPLFPQRSWESFHSRFLNSIADRLNEMLPRRFVAEVEAHLGSRVEADVVEWERLDVPEWEEPGPNGPGGGVAVETWAPPVATISMPALFSDVYEAYVVDEKDDLRVVAVVELVSPGNRDRPEARLAFASKCLAYLQCGVGVVVVDIVTERRFNLHNEMLPLLNLDSRYAMPDDPYLYVVSYRPIQRGDASFIDTWPFALSIGSALPLVPLYLRRFKAIPLDLGACYEDACRRSRI